MMTIVAAYRYGSFAIVISDFRITHKQGTIKSQYDACMKYAQLGFNMGMFFAGDVEYIQKLIPILRSIQSRLTTDNVIDENGPLRQELLAFNRGLGIGKRVFQGIGFLFDPQFNKNEIFMLQGFSGTETLQVKKLASGMCTIIGEGSKVPDLQNALTNLGRAGSSYTKIRSFHRRMQLQSRMIFPKRYKKYDQETIANLLQNKLNQVIRGCGTGVYNELGISPYYVKSLIGKSGFCMLSGTNVDSHITTDFDENGSVPRTTYTYTLEWDEKGKALYWSDSLSPGRVKVQEIEKYIIPNTPVQMAVNPNGQFDPFTFDVPTQDIYIMNQWVEEGGFIERTFYKQIWLESDFYNPDLYRIAIDCKCPPIEIERYKRGGKHILFVSDALAKEFEESVANHVFDHEWLEQYIINYDSFYK
ncbi:hypothetical protein ACP8HI_00755 [Paenibacillus sp. FA6]|uniref:hypothetical protein n=1 Tax=Paenibacillus sp. FA6 TaxID=3413029 RepID=UPI003F65E797